MIRGYSWQNTKSENKVKKMYWATLFPAHESTSRTFSSLAYRAYSLSNQVSEKTPGSGLEEPPLKKYMATVSKRQCYSSHSEPQLCFEIFLTQFGNLKSIIHRVSLVRKFNESFLDSWIEYAPKHFHQQQFPHSGKLHISCNLGVPEPQSFMGLRNFTALPRIQP